MCVIFSFGVAWAIPAIFGQEYAPAIPLAQIMVWSLVWTPLIWFPGFLLSLGRSRTQATLTWIDALIYLFLLFTMIPALSSLGAAIATLLRFITWVGMVIGILIYLDRTHWHSNPAKM
jgi:O-antigen/teichoic acid export membrane protein